MKNPKENNEIENIPTNKRELKVSYIAHDVLPDVPGGINASDGTGFRIRNALNPQLEEISEDLSGMSEQIGDLYSKASAAYELTQTKVSKIDITPITSIGSASSIPVLTINEQGQTTAVVDTPISIPASQIIDFTDAVNDLIPVVPAPLTGLIQGFIKYSGASPYNIPVGQYKTLITNTGEGNLIVNLPVESTPNTNETSLPYRVRIDPTSTSPVVIQTTNGDVINGSASITLSGIDDYEFLFNGNQYWIALA